MLLVAGVCSAGVDLSLDPVQPVVRRTRIVSIQLVASSNTALDASIGAIDAVLSWDPNVLELVGVSGAGGATWFASGFPLNADGLNDGVMVGFVDIPTNDGDAFYTALAPIGLPVAAPPAGVLVTTLRFRALAGSPGTTVQFIPSFGQFSLTRVLDGVLPNTDITGDISDIAVVEVLPCIGDLNLDGMTGLPDLGVLFANWNQPVTPPGDGADVDGSGFVDLADLGALLSDWGCGT